MKNTKQKRLKKKLEVNPCPTIVSSEDWNGSFIKLKKLSSLDEFTKYERQAFSRTIPGEDEFKLLLILVEIGMAIGHGSNSNTTYLLFADNYDHSKEFSWVLRIICAFFMGFGVFFSGSKIIKHVGTKFVTDAYTGAFVAQFTAMVAAMISSVIGYPVSTTQAYFFSLYGLKKFHNNPEIITMDKKLIKWMVTLWLILPFGAIILLIVIGGAFHSVKAIWGL